MFDEVDEGTAMFKAASTLAETPAAPVSSNRPANCLSLSSFRVLRPARCRRGQAQFLYLSVDGTSVPSDYYLSLSGNFTANWRHKRGAAPNASSAEAAVWGDAERRDSYELARRLTERKLAARLGAAPAKTDDDGADETAETPLRPHLVFVLAVSTLAWALIVVCPGLSEAVCVIGRFGVERYRLPRRACPDANADAARDRRCPL